MGEVQCEGIFFPSVVQPGKGAPILPVAASGHDAALCAAPWQMKQNASNTRAPGTFSPIIAAALGMTKPMVRLGLPVPSPVIERSCRA